MQDPKKKNKQLVVSVGLIERDSKFLLTRRVSPNHLKWHHRWELPGGKIDPGEVPVEALSREIYEETFLKIIQPRLLGVYTHHWEVQEGTQQTFILLYHCQAPEGEVLLNPSENDAHCWCSIDEIMKKEDLLDGTVTMLEELFLDKNSSNLPIT